MEALAPDEDVERQFSELEQATRKAVREQLRCRADLNAVAVAATPKRV
jgi:hypothetical protein